MEARVSSERRAGEDAALAYAQDFALARRVVDGDARAEKQLAQRLIVRVRRAAHALLGGAAEADDAALHALIELLRAARNYPGETSLESWADRLAARSLVRFARAVRSRKAGAGAAADELERAERTARTLEEFLRSLPSALREALLLREAFGFDLIETSQLMRSSTRAIRDQLARARLSVYLRTAKDAAASGAALPASVERWFALRDRFDAASPRALNPETGESNDELSAEELEELSALEAQPELRKLQKELRSLAQFIEGGRFAGSGQRDKKLVQAALAAVRVSSHYDPRTAPRAAAETRRVLPPELDIDGNDKSWVRPIALGLCAALVATAFVALALRPPERARQSAPAAAPRAEVVHAPTVEALSSAQAVQRGPRLSLLARGGERYASPGVALEQGASLREADVVSAQAGAGCFALSPRADVCLAKGSEARIAQLGLHARRVELIRGRAVASVERVEPSVPFALSVGELRVETIDAVLGFERDADQIVVRVLRGSALVANAAGTHALGSAQSAVQRTGALQLEVVPQPLEKARRDWELLATRASSPASAPRAPSPRTPAPTDDQPADLPAPATETVLVDAKPQAAASEAVPTPEPAAAPAAEQPSHVERGQAEESDVELAPSGTPEELLTQAKELARARRFAEASALYANLIRNAPLSRSAREALVLRGELLSERLREPAEGLSLFDRYLGSGGGLLEVRARYGRILALRHLGRTAEERAASQEFLFSHRDTPQARLLKTRLDQGAQ